MFYSFFKEQKKPKFYDLAYEDAVILNFVIWIEEASKGAFC